MKRVSTKSALCWRAEIVGGDRCEQRIAPALESERRRIFGGVQEGDGAVRLLVRIDAGEPGSRAGQDRQRAGQVPLGPAPSSAFDVMLGPIAHSRLTLNDCSSGPPWNSEASQLQRLRPGPDGQPVESSHPEPLRRMRHAPTSRAAPPGGCGRARGGGLAPSRCASSRADRCARRDRPTTIPGRGARDPRRWSA